MPSAGTGGAAAAAPGETPAQLRGDARPDDGGDGREGSSAGQLWHDWYEIMACLTFYCGDFFSALGAVLSSVLWPPSLSSTAPNAASSRLTGSDAKSFLQGQLTNDIEALEPGTGCYAAFLTTKGKMLGDVRVLDLGDELLARH